MGEPLPHNMEIRVQTGGLKGLLNILHPDSKAPPVIEDIGGVISQAVSVYGNLDDLPYSEIVQAVALTTVRKRRKTK